MNAASKAMMGLSLCLWLAIGVFGFEYVQEAQAIARAVDLAAQEIGPLRDASEYEAKKEISQLSEAFENSESLWAWVEVPETHISQPICSTSIHDAEYWLHHDITGAENMFGCPYAIGVEHLEKNEYGNVMVYGHNMGFGSTAVFAEFARFTDRDFAQDHRAIKLSLPDETLDLSVQFVCVIPGDERLERTDFVDEEDFKMWQEDLTRYVVVNFSDGSASRKTLITFCTCSYNTWSNERTLVVAEVA